MAAQLSHGLGRGSIAGSSSGSLNSSAPRSACHSPNSGWIRMPERRERQHRVGTLRPALERMVWRPTEGEQHGVGEAGQHPRASSDRSDQGPWHSGADCSAAQNGCPTLPTITTVPAAPPSARGGTASSARGWKPPRGTRPASASRQLSALSHGLSQTMSPLRRWSLHPVCRVGGPRRSALKGSEAGGRPIARGYRVRQGAPGSPAASSGIGPRSCRQGFSR